MAAARSPCGGFKTRVLHFKLRYTKDKKCTEEVQRMLGFLFVEEGKLSIKKSSFEEFKLVFFTAKRAVCFEMQPARRRSFCRTLRYILHPVAKKISFFKRNLRIYKRFIYVSYIFSSALKKTYKMRPAQPILLA